MTEMKGYRKFHVYKVHGRMLTAFLLALCLVFAPESAAYAAQNTGGASVPAEPQIQAQGAVVIDAATGQVLYGKNENTKYYPASITKLMTALLVIENCDLNGTVTFSKTATTNLEAGAVSLGMVEGDQLTVRQCLYALLLKSANEVGNALAEHVSGSISAFASLMNQKAAALGCTNTHFVNPHGLNDPNHYTTPYDMALIARAAFANSTLREIDTTLSYKLPATKKSDARTITMGHKMLYPNDSRYYEGIIGGKTGFTSLAGNTLVTGAERNGVRLVAVVMKANGTHYADTKALLDYGFAKMASASSGPGPSPQTSGGDPSASPQAQAPADGDAADTSGPVVDPGVVPGTDSRQDSLQGTNTQQSGQNTGWIQDSTGWYYRKPDGTYAAGEWLNLDGVEYWIDPNGYMATGWRLFVNGDWYYFRSSGAMAKDYWVQDNGKWFYLGGNGVMMKNAVAPGGYILDADGVWNEN